ncbi:MAG TPA: hypothetical protein VH353_06155 [Caulobacteraceae bacterium]|jgi:hypothetical protein|nr:hypothetical protein [Caulobacteraceae bacterium]
MDLVPWGGVAVGLCLTAATPAWSQTAEGAPPANTVAPLVVTPAPRLSNHEIEKAADGFVRARTIVTKVGRVARWRVPMCPVVDGLPPQMNAAINTRVREIAIAAGAPLARAACTPNNVEIEFTARPQELISLAQKRNWILPGYHFASQDKRVGAMDRPIKAWYVTATRSYALGTAGAALTIGAGTNSATAQAGAGSTHVESGPVGAAIIDDPLGPTPGAEPGSHLNDTLSSEFANVLVVVDQAKIAGASTEAIADYVALLALSQVADLDDCNQLPSVLDLLAKGCEPPRTPEMLTASDLAYLKALYGTETRLEASFSRGAMTTRLAQSLEPR